jgi:MYXO-CTERM domain-containing protein
LILAVLGHLAAHAALFQTGDTSLPDTGLDTGLPTDTDDTDGPTDTDDTDGTPTGDTDDTGFCSDCYTSSRLANEQGGGPCEEGCSSVSAGGASAFVALAAAALLLLRRPR